MFMINVLDQGYHLTLIACSATNKTERDTTAVTGQMFLQKRIAMSRYGTYSSIC